MVPRMRVSQGEGATMALNYNLSKVENWQALCVEGETLKPCTQGLIWACMQVGLPGISVKNAGEFFVRLSEIEKTFGPLRGDVFYTPEEIEAHIGLYVNVRPLTAAAFRRSMKTAA